MEGVFLAIKGNSNPNVSFLSFLLESMGFDFAGIDNSTGDLSSWMNHNLEEMREKEKEKKREREREGEEEEGEGE